MDGPFYRNLLTQGPVFLQPSKTSYQYSILPFSFWFQVFKILSLCRWWRGWWCWVGPLLKPHLDLLQPAGLVLQQQDGDGDQGDVEPGQQGGEEERDRPAEEEQRGDKAQRLQMMILIRSQIIMFHEFLTWSRVCDLGWSCVEWEAGKETRSQWKPWVGVVCFDVWKVLKIWKPCVGVICFDFWWPVGLFGGVA